MCIFVANTRPVRTTITGESLQRPLTTQPPFSNTVAAIGFRATPLVISGASIGFQRLLDICFVSLPNPTADLMVP